MAVKQQDDGTLGGLIRSRRQAAGMLIRDLKKKTGLSVGYISRLESNLAANPSDGVIHNLAKALRVDPITIRQRIKPAAAGAPPPARAGEGTAPQGASATDTDVLWHVPSETLNRQSELESLGAIPENAPARDVELGSDGLIAGPHPLTQAYEALASAYIGLGETYCRTLSMGEDDFEFVLYEEGLTAYRAGESICAHAHLPVLLQKIRYRRARTYMSLVEANGVPPEEQMIYLYRAVELLDLVISALSRSGKAGRPLSHDERKLYPASLAISANLFGMIRSRNYEASKGRGSDGSAERQQDPQVFEATQNTLADIRDRRQRQADELYEAWIQALEAEACLPDDERADDARGRLPYAHFLRAMNLKREQGKEDVPQRDLGATFAHFGDAVTLQQGLLRERAPGSPPAQMEIYYQDLARYHTEWGEAYATSQEPLPLPPWVYAAALWQFQLATHLAPDPAGLYTAFDKRRLEQYVRGLMERAPSDDLAAAAANSAVNALLNQVIQQGGFRKLDYDLTFPIELLEIPDTPQ